MALQRDYSQQFVHADINHNGTIDEKEFRLFLGPSIQEKSQLSNFTEQDIQAFASTPIIQTMTYEIGLDIAVAGFTSNPIAYEIYTQGITSKKDHHYGLGPDVGIGAPDIASQISQYDPAGAMFYYADINHDGKIDQQEFAFFMRSV